MKNARNQHRTDYAKELVKIVQTTKDREELKKKIAAYHERDIANAIVESDKTVRKCIYDILDITVRSGAKKMVSDVWSGTDCRDFFLYRRGTRKISGRNAN